MKWKKSKAPLLEDSFLNFVLKLNEACLLTEGQIDKIIDYLIERDKHKNFKYIFDIKDKKNVPNT
jgi:hypothetical protein